MIPDARKSLAMLKQEWSTCVKCGLAERRLDTDSNIILGEGNPGTDHKRCIMIIGGGPGADEERKGRPFMGPSGRMLRNALTRLGLVDIYYTTAVACRSFELRYTSDGEPIIKTDRGTGRSYHSIRDAQPTPAYLKACRARLLEQIYIVDPLLVITLGAEALQSVTGKPLSVQNTRGDLLTVEVPGAWRVPVYTEKKKVWARKVRGKTVLPTAQSTVRYSVLPTYNPSFILSNSADERSGNPTQCFANDLVMAARVYDRYMWEAYNLRPVERALSDEYIRSVSE